MPVSLHTFDSPLCIIERGIDQGLAELALVDQVRGDLVVAVNANGQVGGDLLDYAGIEIMGPFRQNGLNSEGPSTALEVLLYSATVVVEISSVGGGVKYRA